MYDIYINYFMDDSSPNPVTTERKLYSIPIMENKENALIDPVVKTEMGKTGTFEFSVMPDHPYYNAWLQMKTIMRVEFSGETIFRGRVLTIDNQPMTGAKRIHLEGDFAFLMDSYQEGIPDNDRTEKNLETYLNEVIAVHNSQMDVAGSTHKKMTLGAVPGSYDQNGTSSEQRVHGDTRKYGGNSWRQTTDALSELQREFGGYFRTRYNSSNGTCYLDWLEQCFNPTVNSQPIELTENLIDLNSVTEVDNLFTVLIPVGSNEGKPIYIDGYNGHSGKAITVPEVAAYFVNSGRASELNRRYHSRTEYENAINNYGIIYKSQSFSNADTQEKLWNYATDWVKENYMGGISSFTISALDCHHLDPAEQKYLTGDLVPVIYPNMAYKAHGGDRLINKTLTLTSVKYDLHHPEKNEYTAGIPNGTISKTYGTSNKKTASKSSISKSIGETIGPVGGSLPKVNYERKATAEELSRLAWSYVIDGQYNSDKYKELAERNPEAAEEAAKMSYAAILRNITPEDDPEYRELQNKIDAILFDGPKAKILLQRSIPKEMQQLLVADGKLDPSKKIDAETREKLDTAIEIVADEYISKLTIDEKIGIDPRMPVNDKTRAARLLIDKGDRKTGLDIALETGLLKDPSEVSPFQRPAASLRLLRFIQGNSTTSDPYGITNATSKVATDVKGDTATISSEVLTAGTQGLSTAATMMLDGFNSAIKMVKPSDSGNFATDKLMGLLNGSSGTLATIKGVFGLNGSGGKGTIDLDGLTSKFTIKPTASAGTSGAETFLADGAGEVKAGKSGSSWRITMNTPFTYHDDGNEYTLPAGGIRAEDFQLYSQAHPVESFRCAFAYIDTVVVRDLYAMKAYIDKISANTIAANSYVRAANGYFTNTWSSNLYATGNVYFTKTNGSNVSLQKCYNQCLISESGGTITLTMYPADGSSPRANYDIQSFNMAATTFYKDAVAAARVNGWGECYADIGLNYSSNQTINPGGSITIYPACKPSPTGQHASITSKGIRVTANSGGGGGGVSYILTKVPDSSGNPGFTWYNSFYISGHRWLNIKFKDGSGIYLDINP